MTPAIVESISERYIELFENITGEKFVKEDTSNIAERIEKNVMAFLCKIGNLNQKRIKIHYRVYGVCGTCRLLRSIKLCKLRSE